MLIPFMGVLFGMMYLVATPDVQTFQELSKMDISVIIVVLLSFLRLSKSP